MTSDGLFDIPDAPVPLPSGSLSGNSSANAPLAVRMRPTSLDELVGQQHLLAPGSPLRQMIDDNKPLTILLWGPSGTGKTTIASLLSAHTERPRGRHTANSRNELASSHWVFRAGPAAAA
jgi:putative ATPase